MRLWLASIVLAVAVSSPAAGQDRAAPMVFYKTGNQLLSECEARDPACVVYISGVADSYAWTQGPNSPIPLFCLRSGTTARQLVDVTLNWMQHHPEVRHGSAAVQVGLAITEAFPCSISEMLKAQPPSPQ